MKQAAISPGKFKRESFAACFKDTVETLKAGTKRKAKSKAMDSPTESL